MTPALRLSQTTAFGTPPMAASAPTCTPIQSGSLSAPARLRVGVVGCSERGDEDVRLPGVSPVRRSNTGTVSPAKSTNSFSPADVRLRIVADIAPAPVAVGDAHLQPLLTHWVSSRIVPRTEAVHRMPVACGAGCKARTRTDEGAILP